MKRVIRKSLLIITILQALTVALASIIMAEPQRVGSAQVELISETKSIQAGQPFWIALKMVLDEDWHVYWRNPGDAGLPPKLVWKLPEGFTVGEIQWPVPEVIVTEPLVSYGYHDDVIYPVQILPPANLAAGQDITLEADGSWLICEKVCVPGKAKLSITLAVTESAPDLNKTWSPKIAKILDNIPLGNNGWKASFDLDGKMVHLDMVAPDNFDGDLEGAVFLPNDQGLLSNAAPQILSKTGNGYRLTIQRSEYEEKLPGRLEGLLVWPNKSHSADSPGAIVISASSGGYASVEAYSSDASIWYMLLLAFGGGIILNLMPCVLPILSLKILNFVNKAGESRSKVLGHGFLFTAGVLISFWILAGTLLILRQGGEQLGWGFQLQSPVFLIVLSGFMFLFGLSLLGVFEIGTSLASVGSASASKGGGVGSFMNGVTATVVATPCTAPLMGPALGFAISQPTFVSLSIFTSVGLGMASPYILLSAFPGLLKFLPKPGAWMETMKQIMGFLLLGTIIWLGWVLSIISGGYGVVILMFTLLFLGIAAWILGRWGMLSTATRPRRIAQFFAMVFVIGGLGFGLKEINSVEPPGTSTIKADGTIHWEEYSDEKVAQLTSEGKPLFIDFTAAWCISCQVNERLAFSSEEVQNRFTTLGITALKADWTMRDDKITRSLAKYGRNSVPLYVLYGVDGEYTILPSILTPDIVINALNALNKVDNNGPGAVAASLTSEITN